MAAREIREGEIGEVGRERWTRKTGAKGRLKSMEVRSGLVIKCAMTVKNCKNVSCELPNANIIVMQCFVS